MVLRESTFARIGFVALALVEWRHAAILIGNGLLPLHPAAIGFVAALYLTSFALLLKATAHDEPKASRVWIFGPMLLVIAAFAYQDLLRKGQAGIYPTTDGHAFMDIAARLLVQGKNPYTHSLTDAFRVYQLPIRYSTPLLDGNFSDRVAYPSLSFLALAPFVVAHLPTYLAYAACFVVAVFWIALRSPWWARCLVFALFTHDETFLQMTFGGVTDSLWALCLVGAALTWSRPMIAALFVGLACSQKQHPWFFVPYFAIRLWREHGNALSWRGVPLQFLVRVAGVFALVNLPFVIWGPKAWFLGIVEPLVAPMIQLSEGLTALGMTGYVVVPRGVTSLIFWIAFAYSLFVYARHTKALKLWCFVLPAIVLWFGYRALMSYWYFNALLAVAAIVATPSVVPDAEGALPEARSRLTIRAGLALAAAVVATLTFYGLQKPPFEAAVVGPLESWETHVFRMRVRVTSHLSYATEPRFSVQTNGVQPLQWVVDIGGLLQPGATADYVLRAPRPDTAFEIMTGARVSVATGESSARAFFSVEPDLSVLRVDRLPNASFTVLDARTLLPYGWGFERGDAAVRMEQSVDAATPTRIALVFDPKRPEGEPARSCFPSQKISGETSALIRTADLFTTVELPLEAFGLRVNVPPKANLPPWNELYGLHLAVQGWEGFVLFGAPVERGVLPSGKPFINLPAARATWADVTLFLPDILRALEAPLDARRFSYLRFPDLDVPATPVQVGLFASFGVEGTGRVEFGAFTQSLSDRNADRIVERSVPSPGRTEWRASREFENGNAGAAARLLDGLVQAQPTLDRLTLLGDVELRNGRPERARDAYQRALSFGRTPAVEKGLGWSLIHSGDPESAIPHLEAARDVYATIEKERPRPKYFDTLCALVIAHAKVKDCAGARRFVDLAREEDPRFAPPTPDECR